MFFIESINDLGRKDLTINSIYSLLDYSKKEVEIKKELLRNTIAGILLYYINRHTPNNYSDFVQLTNRQIDLIIS